MSIAAVALRIRAAPFDFAWRVAVLFLLIWVGMEAREANYMADQAHDEAYRAREEAEQAGAKAEETKDAVERAVLVLPFR